MGITTIATSTKLLSWKNKKIDCTR